MLRSLFLFHFAIAIILDSTATTAKADGIVQFGVIYSEELRAGTDFVPAQGIETHTFVVANLGSTNLSLSDFSFTSSPLFTTTPVTPILDAHINAEGLVIAPGQALGYINGDYNQTLTLSYVQSFSA